MPRCLTCTFVFLVIVGANRVVDAAQYLPSGVYECTTPQGGSNAATAKSVGKIEILPDGAYKIDVGPGGTGTYEIRGAGLVWLSGPLSSYGGLLEVSSFDLMAGPKRVAGCRLPG